MTLDSLCRMAARCADRSDEFVGTPFPHNDGWMNLCIQWVLDGCAPRN